MLQPVTQPATEQWDAEQPWNRQPCDTDDTWPLFVRYVQCALPRRVDVLARAVHLPITRIEQVARDAYWHDRAIAYDNWVHQQYNAQVVTYVLEHARDTAAQHVAILDMGLELAFIEFERMLRAAKEQTMHGMISPRELIRLTTEFVKLRRLLTGESTERIEISEIEGMLRDMPLDQLEALEGLQSRLLKGK